MFINTILIIIVISALLVIWGVNRYNRFIGARNRVQEDWSDVENLLRRRFELIPRLIEIITPSLENEKPNLEEINKLRTQSRKTNQMLERSQIEIQLSEKLSDLFSVTENYPEILTNPEYIEIRDRFEAIEKAIQKANHNYNKDVKNLNGMIETFPGKVFANANHFPKAPYFEVQRGK